MVLKKTINADGVITVEDDGRWFYIPKYVDTYGINWEFKHFVVLCVLITVVTFEELGFWGFGLFMFALAIYTLDQRRKADRCGSKKTVYVKFDKTEKEYEANGAYNGDLPPV